MAVFCGSSSVVPSGSVFSSEVLPSFQPAFCSMLLRTVWFSTQSRAPGGCSAGPQGAHDGARATGWRAPAAAHGAGATPAPLASIASAVFLVKSQCTCNANKRFGFQDSGTMHDRAENDAPWPWHTRCRVGWTYPWSFSLGHRRGAFARRTGATRCCTGVRREHSVRPADESRGQSVVGWTAVIKLRIVLVQL